MSDLISRQAAIDVAKEELDNGTFYDIPSKIESLPPAQPKPDEWCTDCKEYDTEKHCCPRFNRVIRNALKDAQPEPKKGKWVKDKYGNIICSECKWCAPKIMQGSLTNRHLGYEKSNFCWNCGAKMEREQKHLGNKSDLVILDEVKYE